MVESTRSARSTMCRRARIRRRHPPLPTANATSTGSLVSSRRGSQEAVIRRCPTPPRRRRPPMSPFRQPGPRPEWLFVCIECASVAESGGACACCDDQRVDLGEPTGRQCAIERDERRVRIRAQRVRWSCIPVAVAAGFTRAWRSGPVSDEHRGGGPALGELRSRVAGRQQAVAQRLRFLGGRRVTRGENVNHARWRIAQSFRGRCPAPSPAKHLALGPA